MFGKEGGITSYSIPHSVHKHSETHTHMRDKLLSKIGAISLTMTAYWRDQLWPCVYVGYV